MVRNNADERFIEVHLLKNPAIRSSIFGINPADVSQNLRRLPVTVIAALRVNARVENMLDVVNGSHPTARPFFQSIFFKP